LSIQRLTLAQIETAVLQIAGFASSAVAPWGSAANFYLRANEYGQRLPQKIAAAAQELRANGQVLPYNGIPRFDMWKTVSAASGTSTTTGVQVASASQTIYMPVDFDHWISLYDVTNKRNLDPVEDVDKWHLEALRDKPAGPPEAFEMLGFATEGSNWRRVAKLYPATAASTTPNLLLTYWRLPAAMPGNSPSAEYPDVDPKYESIWIWGTATDLARQSGFEFDRCAALEKEMLLEMAMTARGM